MPQVCVDIFITTQTYVDIASISVVPGTTGGQVTISSEFVLGSKYVVVHKSIIFKINGDESIFMFWFLLQWIFFE